MQQYSPFFETLYDQENEVGSFGRGTHYSVLRCLSRKGPGGQPLPPPAVYQDFAVIWDEDHDDRVIAVIEDLYVADLLFPIHYIGERKGSLSVIVSDDFMRQVGEGGRERFEERVGGISEPEGDSWSADVTGRSEAGSSIIAAQPDEIHTYLATIDLLWSLGSKPSEAKCREVMATPPICTAPVTNEIEPIGKDLPMPVMSAIPRQLDNRQLQGRLDLVRNLGM